LRKSRLSRIVGWNKKTYNNLFQLNLNNTIRKIHLDAYYIYRISLGKKPRDFNIQKLVWWDNVFVQRLSKADAGLNRGEVVIGNELKPDTSYAYFVETTDSNAMGETNICVFQPHQVFTTPSAKQVVATPRAHQTK
jgi:hypothetical protein